MELAASTSTAASWRVELAFFICGVSWVSTLGFERCEIAGDCGDIVVGELGHGHLHHQGLGAVAIAVAEVDHLPRELAWRATDDPRDVGLALQVGAVAHRAGHGFAVAAGFDESFANLQA